MIIECSKDLSRSLRAEDVAPGRVVLIHNEYCIRGDAVDEFNDPLFVRLSDGEALYPDAQQLYTVVDDIKVVVV